MKLQKNKEKEIPAFVNLSLGCLSQAVDIMGNLMKALKSKDTELRYDRICGHWLGLDIDCSATVIKDGSSYLISFFHDGYMDGQLRTVTSGRGIQVKSTSPEMPDSEVYLFDENNRLVIEGYGTFIRDHIIGYISSNDMRFPKRKHVKYKQSKK